jgi:hypothetical protein
MQKAGMTELQTKIIDQSDRLGDSFTAIVKQLRTALQ